MNSSHVQVSSLLPSIAYSIQGIVVGVPNMLMALCVLKHKALRNTKEYLLICALSIADTLNQFSYFSAGVYRTLVLVRGQQNDLLTPWDCMKTVHCLCWSFSNHIATLMLCVVSIDRLLAVTIPLTYIGWTPSYTKSMLAGAYSFTLLLGGVGLAAAYQTRDQEPSLGKICSPTAALTKATNEVYSFYYRDGPPLLAWASVLLYLAVWLKHKHHLKNQAGLDTSESVKRQSKFTVILGLSSACTFFFFIIPFSLGNLFYHRMGYKNIGLFFFISANLNPICNFIIYQLRHREMQQALLALVKGKKMPGNITQWKQMNVKDQPPNRNHAWN